MPTNLFISRICIVSYNFYKYKTYLLLDREFNVQEIYFVIHRTYKEEGHCIYWKHSISLRSILLDQSPVSVYINFRITKMIVADG